MPFIKELVIHGFKSFARETRIPFKNTMNVIVGPNGSGKSCKYSTKVLLDNGKEIEIGKLVEEQLKKFNESEIKKLDDGIYVNGDNSIKIISLNKNNMKVEKKTISKFIKREGEIIYKIKTRTGKELEATGCHPVMIFNEGKVESSLIKDLNKGSFIAAPRIIAIEGKDNFNKDIARLLGYIIGDGYIAEDRIEFVNKDPEVLEDFKKIIREKFKIEIKERLEKNITRLYIREKSFVKYIRAFFTSNSKNSITSENKKIPDILLESNKEIISNLLSGLYDADGSVRKDIGIIEFCTKNKEMASQIQGLLLRFGIICKIKKRMCCASNTINKTKREYSYIYIYGFENMNRFLHSIPLRIKYKIEAIRSFTDKQVEPNPNTDLLPRQVNFIIRDTVKDLGIKIKPIRKEYPSLCAYLENRCAPSRTGVLGFINLFENKLITLTSSYENLELNQINLVNCMDDLHISGWQASSQIGLNKGIIRNNWATNNFHAKPENLQKFHDFLKSTLAIRLLKAVESIKTLKALANSDIYWDEIVSIEQEAKELYVYDLTIEDNHNFIANNLFVHNSNVTDAICFVLGRLGSKSMRAKKLSNLIFAGTEKYKPANEANVKLIFDNSDRGFSLNEQEVVIERVLRKNGQGVYKINDEVKTRQEILELLIQAGIDPNGFNIVLQGEIDAFVKMPPDQRREVIEEVAGIGVYEMRKQKSLQELEKTDERLKEANAILRERTAYLKNLEDERRQALQFKKLQEEIVVCKASISNKQLSEKNEALEIVNKNIQKEEETIEKIRVIVEKTEQEVAVLNQKINDISSNVQKSSGLEQDRINREISDLRADMAGLTFKKNDFENKIQEMKKRKTELDIIIDTQEREIIEMSKSKGKSVKKDLDLKKQQLDQMDEQKRKLYLLKSQLGYLVSRIEEKQKQIQRLKIDYEYNYTKIQQMESEISIKDSLENHKEKIVILKSNLEKTRNELAENTKKRNDFEKTIAVCEREIENQKKIQGQVSQLDICPLCKTKITPDHISHVIGEAKKLVDESEEKISNSQKSIKQLHELNEKQAEIIFKIENEIKSRSQDVLRLGLIDEKKELLRKFTEELKLIQKEAQDLEKKKDKMEEDIASLKTSESNYDTIRLEVQELQRHEEAHAGMEVNLKQRDVERNKNLLKEILRNLEEVNISLEEVSKSLEEKQSIFDEKTDQDQLLKDKYRKALEEKNKFQEKVHFYERDLMHKQNDKRVAEEKINNFKIERAQLNAQRETIEIEYKSYGETRIMRASIDELRKRIEELQNTLSRIGTVNLKALEVYQDVKSQYDMVQEKVTKIQEEKLEILKVIEDIDKKKKKVFLQTLEELNKLFSRNFSQLSTKGVATLEPVDKDDIFKAGVEMLIKVGKGKYFDTHSLSGGEQSLISLSLIFAIQEYKPYPFYIFDEIDAALDRRNSERLAALLKRYINKGQYIIITHNDSLITESPVIYGVSMQEKISKVISLEV